MKSNLNPDPNAPAKELTPEEKELAALQVKANQARAKREAAEAKREHAEAMAALNAQIAADEQAEKDAELIEKYEIELGPIGRNFDIVRSVNFGSVIVARPHMVSFRKFQETGKYDWATLQKLVSPCLKHPTKTEFDTILNDEPALLLRCANTISTLAGVTKGDVQKG